MIENSDSMLMDVELGIPDLADEIANEPCLKDCDLYEQLKCVEVLVTPRKEADKSE